MRRFNLTQARVFIFDPKSGKMVEKKKLSADNRLEITTSDDITAVTDSAGNTFKERQEKD